LIAAGELQVVGELPAFPHQWRVRFHRLDHGAELLPVGRRERLVLHRVQSEAVDPEREPPMRDRILATVKVVGDRREDLDRIARIFLAKQWQRIDCATPAVVRRIPARLLARAWPGGAGWQIVEGEP
jgi:hypothetical protein